MPSNFERHNLIARQEIDKMLHNLRDIPDGMHINEVVRQVTLVHPVSPAYVKKYIKDCYVTTGLLEDYDGQLTFKKKW